MAFDPNKPFEAVSEPVEAPGVSTPVPTDWRGLYANSKSMDALHVAGLNQSYWRTRITSPDGKVQMDPETMSQNWPSIKTAIASRLMGKDLNAALEFGEHGKEFSDEEIATLTAKDLQEAKDGEEMEPGQRAAWQFRHRMTENGKGFWKIINMPLVQLPDAPPLPNIPELGAYNPALWGATWKAVKPVLEGLETPLGTVTMGVGSDLVQMAKQYPAAKAALLGLSGTFSAMMGYGTYEAIEERNRVMADPKSTFEDKLAAHLKIATNAGLTLLGALGMVEAAKPKLLPELKDKSIPDAVDHIKIDALTEKNSKVAEKLNEAADQLDIRPPVQPSNDVAKAAKSDLTPEQQKAWNEAANKPVEQPPVIAEHRETALKNATAEMERAGYGMEEVEPEQSHEMAASWARAGAALERQPAAGERLAKALKDNPNIGLSDDQSALLLRHKVGLQNAIDDAMDVANDSSASPAARKAANNEAQGLAADLKEFMDAVHARGSEWGREGRWRQAMAKEDYSFAAQEQLLRAAKGSDLTPEDRAGLMVTIDEIRKKQAQIEEHIAGLNAQPKKAGRVLDYLAEKADEARARLKERQANQPAMSGGINPEDLDDYAIIGAHYLAKGITKSAEWTSAMVKEFGESIRPILKDILDKSKEQRAAATKEKSLTHDDLKGELNDLKAKISEITDREQKGEKPEVPRDEHTPRKRPTQTEEHRLNQWKSRAQARILDLQDRLQRGDIAPKARAKPVDLDEPGHKLQGQLEKLKQDLMIARNTAAEAAKPGYQKVASRASSLARAGAISGYHTLAKLGAYSLGKFAEVIPVEMAGKIEAMLPGMKGIRAKATMEAGSEAMGIGKFYSSAVMKGIPDMLQTLKSGKSDLMAEVGHKNFNTRPQHWEDYIGTTHMAEKSILYRADFEMRLQKAYAHAYDDGADLSDIDVRAAIRKEVGDYSQKSILQENNQFADWINNGLRRMESVDPKTGKADAQKVILANLIRTFVTKGIVRTPSNYIMQTLERTPLGMAEGTRGYLWAQRKGGVAALSDKEANAIVRLMKVGAVGSAMFVWGCIDATKPEKDRIFGGYYQPGDKRKKEDVSFGKLRVDGVEIPHFLSHFPMTESAQMGNTFMRVMLSKLHKGDTDNKGALAGAFASVLALASSAPVANPITRTAESVQRGQADRVLWDEISGLVPQFIQNLAVDTDKEKRAKPKSLKEAVELTVPGLRQNVPKKRSTFSLRNE